MRYEDSKSKAELSAEFIKAAEEDLELLEYIRREDFRICKNACQLAARYSEKIIKARLLQLGISVSWIHDQRILLMDLPDTPERKKALEIAKVLSVYSTMANYPSITREEINPEPAREAYELAIQMPYLIGVYEKD